MTVIRLVLLILPVRQPLVSVPAMMSMESVPVMNARMATLASLLAKVRYDSFVNTVVEVIYQSMFTGTAADFTLNTSYVFGYRT